MMLLGPHTTSVKRMKSHQPTCFKIDMVFTVDSANLWAALYSTVTAAPPIGARV